MTRTILSLFDYSGQWSDPYRVRGYDVIQIDIKRGQDVLRINPASLPDVHGILAAPPCTDFAVSGAQYWPAKDADGRTEQSIRLVHKTLEIVHHFRARGSLAWWCIENPVGRLNRLVSELCLYGPHYVQPFWYGDAYTKKTGLWGEFVPPSPTRIVEPERVSSQGSWLMLLGGKSERTKELRSMTPPGFALAFCEVNP